MLRLKATERKETIEFRVVNAAGDTIIYRMSRPKKSSKGERLSKRLQRQREIAGQSLAISPTERTIVRATARANVIGIVNDLIVGYK